MADEKKKAAPADKKETPPEKPFQRDKELNLEQRINLIMADTHKLVKEKFVEQGRGGFKVITSDQVTAHIQPLIVKHGVNIKPTVLEWAVVEPDPQINPETGKRYPYRTEADVRVRWVNIDNPGDFDSGDWFGFGMDSQDKGPGKAVTYAIRYAILKTLQIPTGDADVEDDDVNLPAGKTSKSKSGGNRRSAAGGGGANRTGKADPNKIISSKQEGMLRAVIKEYECPNEIVGEFMAEVKRPKFENLTNAEFDHLLHRVTSGSRGALLPGFPEVGPV